VKEKRDAGFRGTAALSGNALMEERGSCDKSFRKSRSAKVPLTGDVPFVCCQKKKEKGGPSPKINSVNLWRKKRRRKMPMSLSLSGRGEQAKTTMVRCPLLPGARKRNSSLVSGGGGEKKAGGRNRVSPRLAGEIP